VERKLAQKDGEKQASRPSEGDEKMRGGDRLAVDRKVEGKPEEEEVSRPEQGAGLAGGL